MLLAGWGWPWRREVKTTQIISKYLKISGCGFGRRIGVGAWQKPSPSWSLTTIPLSLDFSIIMGQLEHTSEKATPYGTDEMQVKNGVFDRVKSLVKTR